ncbi:UDP-N-acetylmuramate dehydrogenase [Lapidilactobacillus mulanensis]|uniref:UDP-N-acetylenolpyruvoylglucosamine reductase n=1 Tax=Lapidilactobacillus mulanensis TaxID=2485999 RepID=A0ABW4DN16_9LACO|nr:UDP-N-acetylmuramate dehydrogenase [Lapidilactobacillus mulanensis]
MESNAAIVDLEKLGMEIKKDCCLAQYSNTKTGGNVDVVIFPHSLEQLKVSIQLLKQLSTPVVVLGDMTNVAIASKNLNFNVICMSHFVNEPIFDAQNGILTVTAGYKMKQLSRWALNHSISGLQWMEGIPGTVGAGVFMNAGYLAGQEFQDIVIDTQVLMPDLSVQTLSNKDLNYSYRHSSIQGNKGIVLSTRLLVRVGKKWKIRAKMAQYHKRRAKNQPLNLPSAGTVFVPPTPYHVGGMLPELGIIGYRIGGAEISPKSPGFIVGVDHMTGEDYYEMVRFIQRAVKEKYNIELEPEVRLLGFNDDKTE